MKNLKKKHEQERQRTIERNNTFDTNSSNGVSENLRTFKSNTTLAIVIEQSTNVQRDIFQ